MQIHRWMGNHSKYTSWGFLRWRRFTPIEQTLGLLLKYQEDVGTMRAGGARTLLDESRVVGR